MSDTQIDDGDVTVEPIERALCSTCDENGATHVVYLDIRSAGAKFALIEAWRPVRREDREEDSRGHAAGAAVRRVPCGGRRGRVHGRRRGPPLRPVPGVSQGAGESVSRDFDWKLTHLALFRVLAADVGVDEKVRFKVEHLGSQKHFETGQELLEEMLDRLLAAAWAKKVGINDASSCRAYVFRDTSAGKVDRDLLSDLVSAPTLDAFEAPALSLSECYAALPRASAGVLVHAAVTVDSGRAKSLPFYFLIKCDFEDARKLAEDRSLLPSPEVMLEKLKKSVIYPHFDGFQPDPDRVKVFQATASDDFADLLEIDKPATAKELITRELRDAVASRFQDRYDDYFVGMPDGKREVFGPDRSIPLDDLMPLPEVKYVTEKTCRVVKDKHDKLVTARIKVDESVAVTLDLAALGKAVFFAQQGAEHFLIIRGEHFITSGNLTGLDFLDPEQLEKVIADITPT